MTLRPESVPSPDKAFTFAKPPFTPVAVPVKPSGRVPALPYLAMSERSRSCNYTLGHTRPGSPERYVWYYPRASLTGLTLEGVIAAGLILASP